MFCFWMASTISGMVMFELGQLVGPDPEAHGILAGPEDGDTGNAGHPGDLIVQVDIGVIGQEGGVVGTLGRNEVHHHQGRGRGLLDGDAIIAHIGRELGFGLALPHLGQHLVDIRVGFDVEVHVQLEFAVVGVQEYI